MNHCEMTTLVSNQVDCVKLASRVTPQNHIETEKLVDSLPIACHQPGGKNNKSPGPKTVLIAFGTTSSIKTEDVSEKTSIGDVLLSIGSTWFCAGLRSAFSAEGCGCGNRVSVRDGGANQIVL